MHMKNRKVGLKLLKYYIKLKIKVSMNKFYSIFPILYFNVFLYSFLTQNTFTSNNLINCSLINSNLINIKIFNYYKKKIFN